MPKKVLITGGSGDIAQAIKSELLKDGFDVMAPSRTEMDVTDWDSIENVISNYKPDILINVAGYLIPKSIKEADLENTKRHIDVNLSGVFYCTEIGLKYNKELDIINVGSAAAIESHATWSEYCATKAGVAMATKCWAEDGLYAVCISPGRTRTKMRKSLYPDEDQNTLLDPTDFARVIMKAVYKEFENGIQIIVRKQNVEQILRGEI
ncbi:MAG: SDR family oxidoreductase [Ruminococcaceae bacterium]|nr:SDR family oxidoreductase [Oscillospiraceae bacterium]